MHGPAMEEDDGQIAQINIIPLVDVVLVLLIIFMVTTVFTRDTALPLDLPKGSRPEQVAQPPAEITVSVNERAEVFVNGKPTRVEELERRIKSLQNADRKTLIVLRGDRKVIYGDIMPVLDEVSRTGIEMTLALKPGPAK